MIKSSILIGIAGGTGSGKTSVAKELTREFRRSEVTLIEQDAFYRDLSHLPIEERQKINFDHPDAVDFELMKDTLERLLRGETVKIPEYDYTTHSRSDTVHEMERHHIIVLEGILCLLDESIRNMMDIKIYVETADDIRIIRRIRRDINERERTLESVIVQYYSTVRPMHKQFVEPTKKYADIIIPEGGRNVVAIDIIRTKINSLLQERISSE